MGSSTVMQAEPAGAGPSWYPWSAKLAPAPHPDKHEMPPELSLVVAAQPERQQVPVFPGGVDQPPPLLPVGGGGGLVLASIIGASARQKLPTDVPSSSSSSAGLSARVDLTCNFCLVDRLGCRQA